MENTENGVIITRVFDAPRELVWKAWTEPEMIKKWWGPEGFTSPSAKVDLRVGGKYIYAMHGPAGSEWDRDMYSAGIFKEIVLYEKIVVTDYFSDAEGNMINPDQEGQDSNFPKEMAVTILFEEVDNGKTKLSVIYPKPETAEQMEAMLKSGMEEGWNSSLNKLEIALKQ
ncbi:MAG TPA: SRPBCC domain-containing protein [Candidatus Woesebacteria bacterium]|mgnify:CR=1 FL=1|nr:SRPBCC domain-containing protein [Candidatus Woesebacteria bacterium]